MSSLSYRYFWIKRSGTLLTVIVPVLFLLLYLLPVSSILSGKDAFDLTQQLRDVEPLHAFKEIVFFLLFVGYTVNAVPLAYSSLSGNPLANFACVTLFLRGICAFISVIFIAHFFFAARLAYIFTPAFLNFSKFTSIYGHGFMRYFFCAGLIANMFTLFSSVVVFAFENGFLISSRSRNSSLVIAWCAFLLSALWCLRICIAL